MIYIGTYRIEHVAEITARLKQRGIRYHWRPLRDPRLSALSVGDARGRKVVADWSAARRRRKMTHQLRFM